MRLTLRDDSGRSTRGTPCRLPACVLSCFVLRHLLLALCPLSIAFAQTFVESPEVAAAFQKAGVVGTFVVGDAASGELKGYNAARAAERFIPASTFKIPNSLIALDLGAVTGVEEVFPYDGKPRAMPEWEKAMTLREAIRVSNVPVYQEVARRIGLERMRESVTRIGYGNAEIGEVVDRFWLDGPLKISAIEQVDFLRRLAGGDLPVKPAATEAVREITLLEKIGDAEFHGKTGWGTARTPAIGWFVGWVERGGRLYPFALNLDAYTKEDIARRIPLAKECLRALGILPTATD